MKHAHEEALSLARVDEREPSAQRARHRPPIPHDERRRESSASINATRNAEPTEATHPTPTLGGREATVYERFVKPAFDRVVAALLLLLLSPVLLLAALTLWFALGSPILFRQARMGRDNAPFDMYKFRTMHPDRRRRAEDFDGPDRRRTHKTANDPRHTRVGRVLRQTSIDELPQLFNVVKGEMSLVGPRPELLHIVDRYEPWQHARHHVKPGLTGLWQISERGNGLMHEHVEIDLTYVEQVSFATDCKVLAKTLPALLKGDTA